LPDESPTEILEKYIALKDERDALKTQLDAITATKEQLAKDYETSKAEIGNLQRIIATHVVATESDKPSKPQTLKDLFKQEADKHRK
jgi:hypothetical protein